MDNSNAAINKLLEEIETLRYQEEKAFERNKRADMQYQLIVSIQSLKKQIKQTNEKAEQTETKCKDMLTHIHRDY